ncbi:hypothetical protein [Pontibacterium sp.]|uniref:hypothetical protein n=1 Tax=Pontibacterium sp. TaxID=2036026 RepID=UPI003568F33A
MSKGSPKAVPMHKHGLGRGVAHPTPRLGLLTGITLLADAPTVLHAVGRGCSPS